MSGGCEVHEPAGLLLQIPRWEISVREKKFQSHTYKSIPLSHVFEFIKWMFSSMNEQVTVQKL